MSQTRKNEGVHCLPNGKDFYRECLTWHLETKMSPEEVHSVGKSEVARLRQRMEQVIKECGFSGSFKEFLQFLRTNEKFYHKTKVNVLIFRILVISLP